MKKTYISRENSPWKAMNRIEEASGISPTNHLQVIILMTQTLTARLLIIKQFQY